MENGDLSYKKGVTGHFPFILRGHEAVQERNRGAGITERCSDTGCSV
jgi:hypothetical protein